MWMSEVLPNVYLPFTETQLKQHFAPVGVDQTSADRPGLLPQERAGGEGLGQHSAVGLANRMGPGTKITRGVPVAP